MKLKVINTIRKPEPNYIRIYSKAIYDKLNNPPKEPESEWMRKTIYILIRGLPIIWKEVVHVGSEFDIPKEKFEKNMLGLLLNAEELVSLTTPMDFMKIFPIEKSYKGERNYYCAMEHLKKLGLNKKVDKNYSSFIAYYTNFYVVRFALFVSEVIESIMETRGQEGPMKKYKKETGDFEIIEKDGKHLMSYLGNESKIKKYPEYLKLIKGGK